MGFQYPIKEKLRSRVVAGEEFESIILQARVVGREKLPIKIGLTYVNSGAMTTKVELNDSFRDIEIPLKDLIPDRALLLPRPYPGFMPLHGPYEKGDGNPSLDQAEKLEISFENPETGDPNRSPFRVEIGKIWLK